MSKPPPLTAIEAKAQILTILEDGEIKLSAHLRQERMNQRTLLMDDIKAVLHNGEILRAPEWEENYQNWKYRMEGKDLAGEDLSAIIVIITKTLRLIVVTAF